jgi:hypothetical protein
VELLASATLTSKVDLVEKELVAVGSNASNLLKTIGASNTSAPTLPAAASIKQKLKNRLDALAEYASAVRDKIDILETQYFGMPTFEKVRALAGRSFKNRVENLAAQASDLGRRMSGLDLSSLLQDVSKLDDKFIAVALRADTIFKSVDATASGGDVAAKAAAFARQKGGSLKERLAGIDAYTEEMQRSVSALEFQLLENSWSASIPGFQNARSIKDHMSLLGNKLDDLQQRLGNLEAAPALLTLGKLEKIVAELSQKAATLAGNTGMKVDASLGSYPTAPEDSGLKLRIAALESNLMSQLRTTASLEEQLLGVAGPKGATSRSATMKGAIRNLELLAQGIYARIATITKQV